ncbi:MAG: hypothetical protein LIO90_01980 [Bacteroidales bacterium]|nr:hypothetical protein [Bacteroidales bacterium]
MIPHDEHTFYTWLIIIGAVCIVTFIGAMIDRFYLNRRIRQMRRSYHAVPVKQQHSTHTPAHK